MWNDQVFSPGEIVLFSTHFCTGEPGEWIVLQTNEEEGTALIAATESVGRVPYNKNENESVTWENCYLRTWLNKVFFYYFRAKEKASILENETPVSDDGSKTTSDYVFILSESEVNRLFKDNEERVLLCSHEFNKIWYRVGGWRDSSSWWLRGSSFPDEKSKKQVVPICSPDGELGYQHNVNSKTTGVRPCMWVYQSALKKKNEIELEFLNARLLERNRKSLVTYDFDEERSKTILAEFLDYDTNQTYIIFQDEGGPSIARVELNYDVSHAVEEKARILSDVLSRRPYREVMEKTQFKVDERRVLSSMFQDAWMPSVERVKQYRSSKSKTRTVEFDESGDYIIKLGKYENEDLYWRIIRNNADKAYCLCEIGLRSDTFMDEEYDDSCYWENSKIRQWLNNEFYHDAFSDKEKKHLVTIQTEKESLFSPATFDTVFLMSASEASYLLPSPYERLLKGTPDEISLTRKLGINDYEGDWWWLRTGGLKRDSFCCVGPSGEIDRNGGWGHSVVCAIRPAIIVDLYDSDILISKRMSRS